jgi:TetR/AcrR family transcriptional regulator
MAHPESPSEPHPRPEDSRQAILRAAMDEFAEQGEAGARTDAIARAAGVNKALLHYYFGTKEALYGVVLEQVFGELVQGFLAGLGEPGTAGERLLRHFLRHFDRLAASGRFARLMGHEMLRARSGEPTRLFEIVQVAFRPLHLALNAALAEGMASGELRATDPDSLILSLTGANVFYFISAPVFRSISGKDPRDPEMLARQRVALLEFAATVLFADPEHGRSLARRIHSELPGPRTAPQGEPG